MVLPKNMPMSMAVLASSVVSLQVPRLLAKAGIGLGAGAVVGSLVWGSLVGQCRIAMWVE